MLLMKTRNTMLSCVQRNDILTYSIWYIPAHFVCWMCTAHWTQLESVADQRRPVGHVTEKQRGSLQGKAGPQFAADAEQQLGRSQTMQLVHADLFAVFMSFYMFLWVSWIETLRWGRYCRTMWLEVNPPPAKSRWVLGLGSVGKAQAERCCETEGTAACDDQ